MDDATFWELIDDARMRCKPASTNDTDQQHAILEELLAARSAAEIAEFDQIFRRLHVAAYSWDLWAAAYIIEGGCSDDGFTDFRSGLIGLGREVYENAVRDPATLISLPTRGVDFSNELMMYAAPNAHERVAGEELPFDDAEVPHEPAGRPWQEAHVTERYPELAKKFGHR